MGYSIAFLGDLTFSPGGCAAWQAAVIEGTSVSSVLDQVSGDIIEFERDDSSVKLRLLVSKDDAFYLECRTQTLAAFREAAKHGGGASSSSAGTTHLRSERASR